MGSIHRLRERQYQRLGTGGWERLAAVNAAYARGELTAAEWRWLVYG